MQPELCMQELFEGDLILFGDWLRQEVPYDARVYEQVSGPMAPARRVPSAIPASALCPACLSWHPLAAL